MQIDKIYVEKNRHSVNQVKNSSSHLNIKNYQKIINDRKKD